MNKNTKGMITVVAIAVVVVGVWQFTHQTVKYYAKIIVKLGGHGSYTTLLTFDQAYLKSWAKALSKGSAEFSYDGIRYNTKGGKKIA